MAKFKKGCKPRNKRELAGKRFARLLVLEDTGTTRRGMAVWKCRCDCGNIVNTPAYHFTSGHTRSCGCLKIESAITMGRAMGKPIARGRRFGKLTVICRVDQPKSHKHRNRAYYYECLCDCGEKTITLGSDLRAGNANGCKNSCARRNLPDEAYKFPEKKRNSKYLTDEYIKGILSDRWSHTKGGNPNRIEREYVTPEMIELKREQLIFHRLTKELKNGINSARD